MLGNNAPLLQALSGAQSVPPVSCAVQNFSIDTNSVASRSDIFCDVSAGLRRLGFPTTCAAICPDPKMIKRYTEQFASLSESIGIRNIFISPRISDCAFWQDEEIHKIGLNNGYGPGCWGSIRALEN